VNRLVIDSNVLIASVFFEPYSGQARALLAQSLRAGNTLHAPALLQSEIVTVVRKAVYFGRIDEAEGLRIKNGLLATAITLHHDLGLLNRSYTLAQLLHLPRAYDTQYLALAERLDCEFWTGDERLFNSAKASFPLIRWLGQIEV
jgi:predicted nucleic acid-binding protein